MKRLRTRLSLRTTYPYPQAAEMEAARALLDTPLRVELSDGRLVVGRFTCLDKQQNVLLTDAREMACFQCREDADDASVVGSRQREGAKSQTSERHLGTVIVPRQHIASCHAQINTCGLE